MASTATAIDEGKIAFETEGRLLEELGERLVASPEVALVELIKNAYDADATCCQVILGNEETHLIISDDGQGMTLADFETKWMRIATSSKVTGDRLSDLYKRRLTGAKGIGRFAVRFLGDYLRLESIAFDSKRKCRTKLVALFDWKQLDRARELRKATIPWELFSARDDENNGTRLIISSLKASAEFTRNKDVRSNLIKIVSPITGLERGKFRSQRGSMQSDPGFTVRLPGDGSDDAADIDLAEVVLSNYWARLTIDLLGRNLTYKVDFGNGRQKKVLKVKVPQCFISAGLFADIRFFPRRAGVFAGKEVTGKLAWDWVRENCGVAFVDHGFRIKPYGFKDDDWLLLEADKVHNQRDWRSAIARSEFPIHPDIRKKPGLNPMLYLPYSYQLVGAVFGESLPPSLSSSETDLIPSMDREGFVRNQGFEQLFQIIRAGIEFLALCDKEEIDFRKEQDAKAAAKSTKEEFRKAIQYFENSPTLTSEDRSRIVSEYATLAERFDEERRYEKEARQGLATMSLLGVVAGFMTHESRGMVARLEETAQTLAGLSTRYPELVTHAKAINESLATLKGHLDYTELFIDATQHKREGTFPVAPQIDLLIERFGAVAKERGITISNDVDGAIHTPHLPIAAYSGVLLNLLTNAIKAVIAAPSSNHAPIVRFTAGNDSGHHFVDVADNGIGIPPEIRDRIWDPLFTTTSNLNNPFGSGMGLGLSLVRRLIDDLHGDIELLDTPPPGFTTCFHVTFPL